MMNNKSADTTPKASAFYTNRRSKGIERAVKKLTVKSPITGEPLSYTIKYLDGGPQLLEQLHKSIYNQRSFEHLTREAVSDIFDGIAQTGGNTKEVCGVIDGDKIELLEGSRRTYICSLLPESKLLIKVFDSLTEEEKKHYASTSDEYNAPNAIDTGFSLLKLEAYLKEQGKAHTIRELASIYKISNGAVSENMNFARLPGYLFELFPGLSFIPIRFMRKMLTYSKTIEGFEDTLKEFEPITFDSNQDIIQENVEKTCKTLQQQILATFDASLKDTKSTVMVQSKWRDIKPVRGINVKVNDAGKVTMTFNENNVSNKVLEQLLTTIQNEG